MIQRDMPEGGGQNISTRYAVRTYAVWRATQTARHRGGVNQEVVFDMMFQFLHEAVRRHRKSSAILAAIWT